MRVFIGKYPTYWNTWNFIKKLPVSEQTQDKISDWLEDGLIEKTFEWLNKGKKRKVKVRIDRQDTWSMDDTLAHIILPMLKQLQATKQGSPIVDEEDLPAHMRHGNPNEHDNWVQYKWDWVLSEIIWAFENTVDDSWEEKFSHGEPKYEETEEEIENYGKCFSYKQVNPDYWFDTKGYKAYGERIQNGYRLFGRYYSSLWD